QCAGWRAAGHGRLEVCLACGAVAAPIRERRAVLEPFGIHSLVAAVRWPFHKEALFSAAACALVLWGLSAAGGLGALVGEGIVLSFLFHVLTTAARGHDELTDTGDFRGFFEDVLAPLVRVLTASIWAWGPFGAWVIWNRGGF